MHSYFDGPRSFVVGLDSPDGRYRIHMNLSGLTWRMSAVDVPEPVTARLASLIAQRIGGAVDLPRGLSRPGSQGGDWPNVRRPYLLATGKPGRGNNLFTSKQNLCYMSFG